MSNHSQKMEIQSLSSLSMQHNLKQFGASILFHNAARKSSFDFVNVFKVTIFSMTVFQDSAQFDKKQLKNSLQLLSSNIVFQQKSFIQPKDVFKYSEKQKIKLQQAGVKPIEIGEVVSESQSEQQYDENSSSLPLNSFNIQFREEVYKPTNYLPPELELILKQKYIPLQYVKGLMLVKDNAEIKSARRLKVQRYLEKRRNKTWNRKICYNCRQKVAEERLRIKGKFIKKRRAMELLGLIKPIPMVQLKKLLQKQLHDKTHAEIQELIRKH